MLTSAICGQLFVKVCSVYKSCKHDFKSTVLLETVSLLRAQRIRLGFA